MKTMRHFNGERLPQLVFYSKSGVIPYLNWNFIRKHSGVIYQETRNEDMKDVATTFLTMINMVDVIDLYEKTKKADKKLILSALPHMDRVDLLVTIFDPLESYRDFKSTPEAIPFHSYQGRKMINVPMALDITGQFLQPAYLQALADINAPPEAKGKWTAKVVKRTKDMLEATLEQLEEIRDVATVTKIESQDRCKKLAVESDKRPKLFGSIVGGYSEKARLESCQALLATNVDKLSGVVIDSFYGYHQERDGNNYFEDVYTEKVDRLLRETIVPNLPVHLPRALFGVFFPDDILRLISAGIDLVDTSICTLLSQKGMALPSPLIDQQAAVRLRFTRMTAEEISEHSGLVDDVWPESVIDITHVGYIRANIPISCHCGCYVCTSNYSRAYLNHMLKRHELNGNILLQMHNHWTMTHFMAEVRKIIEEGNFEQLLENSNLKRF